MTNQHYDGSLFPTDMNSTNPKNRRTFTFNDSFFNILTEYPGEYSEIHIPINRIQWFQFIILKGKNSLTIKLSDSNWIEFIYTEDELEDMEIDVSILRDALANKAPKSESNSK